MKILWFSNSPFSSTGYGNQTKLVTPQLKQLGHDISILAFHGLHNYTSSINWNGIPVFGPGFHPYGMDVAVPYYEQHQADILLSLFDAWAFDMQVIRMTRWVPWFPVDHDPIQPDVLEKVRYAFARIVYSRFAEQQLIERELDCHYVPHAINAKDFAPIPPDVREIGKEKIGIPKDVFVVGMVAANKGYPSRKAFEQNIAAFKMLADKHKDVLLFLQTWSGEGGPSGRDCVDLVAYCRSIGLQLGRNVMFCDQMVNVTSGFPDAYMVALYNAMDVLLSVSRGEGFGIPILEAQACGTPVITGDWTSMSELTFSGWALGKDEAVLDPTWQKSNQYLPHVGAIYERLEMAYRFRGDEEMKKRARRCAEEFDIVKVTEQYWKPTIDAIAARVETIKKLKTQVSTPVMTPAAKPLTVKEISA